MPSISICSHRWLPSWCLLSPGNFSCDRKLWTAGIALMGVYGVWRAVVAK